MGGKDQLVIVKCYIDAMPLRQELLFIQNTHLLLVLCNVI